MPTIVARVDGGTLFNGFMRLLIWLAQLLMLWTWWVVGWDIFVVVNLMIGVVAVQLEVEFGWIVVHMMGKACWIVAVNLMGTISVFYLVGWVDHDTVVLYEG